MAGTMRGQVAVVGVGETDYYKRGQSPDAEGRDVGEVVELACERRWVGVGSVSLLYIVVVATKLYGTQTINSLGSVFLPLIRHRDYEYKDHKISIKKATHTLNFVLRRR